MISFVYFFSFELKFTWSYIKIATPIRLWSVFSWYIFFCSLFLHLISAKRLRSDLFFTFSFTFFLLLFLFFQPGIFLIRELNLLTFKVTINKQKCTPFLWLGFYGGGGVGRDDTSTAFVLFFHFCFSVWFITFSYYRS